MLEDPLLALLALLLPSCAVRACSRSSGFVCYRLRACPRRCRCCLDCWHTQADAHPGSHCPVFQPAPAFGLWLGQRESLPALYGDRELLCLFREPLRSDLRSASMSTQGEGRNPGRGPIRAHERNPADVAAPTPSLGGKGLSNGTSSVMSRLRGGQRRSSSPAHDDTAAESITHRRSRSCSSRPGMAGRGHGEEALLKSCYRESLRLAAAHGAGSIAFPAISTGAYGFPAPRAAEVAVQTLAAEAAEHPSLRRIVLCCFGRESRQAHERALEHAPASPR